VSEQTTERFEEWAILELMGHRRLAGRITEQTIGGASFLRLDIPGNGERKAFTQFYSGQAVYCITPTTEAVARMIAASSCVEPVTPYEVRLAIETQPPDEGIWEEQETE